MKSTVTLNEFCNGFCGGYADNFSYDAQKALYAYFEEMEDDCGIEIEFDPVAICCEFSEYGSALECVVDAGYEVSDFTDDQDDDEREEYCLEYLQENTQVITFDGGIIIQSF